MRNQLLLIAALLTLGACGNDPPPQPKTAVEALPKTAPSKDVKDASPSLGVADDILKACNITVSNPKDAPKFEFDSTELLPEDTRVLDQVAQCLSTGPLKGRHLQLVGRADPRGTEQYNFVLGAQRAHKVGDYLEKKGIMPGYVKETSRGNLDATGHDEPSWREDRRVDLVLAP
jgi:peptidoglycan-associated lipoprotein